MMQEHGVHSLTEVVISAEGEREVRESSTDSCSGKILTNPFCCFNKVTSVVSMLFYSSGYGEHIRVKDNVFWLHTSFFHKETIRPLSNGDTATIVGCLPFFVEKHNHNGSSEIFHYFGISKERFFSLLQGNGIDNAFALTALQTTLNDRETTGVDHYWNTTNRGVGHQQVKEGCHLFLGIQKAIVHIHVHNHCAMLHLSPGNINRFIVFLFVYKAEELTGTSYITPLSNYNKILLTKTKRF